MKFRTLALASFCLAFGASAACADTTIRWLHLSNDDAGTMALYNQIIHDFEAQNKGVKIQLQDLENEAFKAKLPTMLQSDKDRPHIFYSWGGGVMRAQAKAGFLEDITAAAAPWANTISPTAVEAFQVDGKTYGIPQNTGEVVFFYNKKLFAKAGVKAEDIKTWDDFLGAVKKIKAAGITPIIVGGGEKWPMHFYWSYLVIRGGGANALADAKAGKDGGFKNATFVEAGKRLHELAALEPFQAGYLSTSHPQAEGMFGDGKGAMELMGQWLLTAQGPNAADGKGQPIDNIGIFSFPTLPGGKGQPTDTLGGINGWLVGKGAPKEAAEFLKFFSQEKYQREAAAKGLYIPVVKGAESAIENPVLKQIGADLAKTTYHQNFFDQDLGPSVGRVVNDISVAVAAGKMSPEDGAAAVQQAWDEQ
ncbi:MAG TPA: extracellular solute-binding protein [Roseiarcus sp.]|nr:extracellular solute-binding protein [Roseiarcus sp.]